MPPFICDAAVTHPAGRTPPSGAGKKGTAGAVPFLYGTALSIAALTQPELDGGHVLRAGALLTEAPLKHPPVKGIDRLCLADIVAVAGQHVSSAGAESVIQHIHADAIGIGRTRPLRHEGVRASGAEYVRDLPVVIGQSVQGGGLLLPLPGTQQPPAAKSTPRPVLLHLPRRPDGHALGVAGGE